MKWFISRYGRRSATFAPTAGSLQALSPRADIYQQTVLTGDTTRDFGVSSFNSKFKPRQTLALTSSAPTLKCHHSPSMPAMYSHVQPYLQSFHDLIVAYFISDLLHSGRISDFSFPRCFLLLWELHGGSLVARPDALLLASMGQKTKVQPNMLLHSSKIIFVNPISICLPHISISKIDSIV